MNITSIEDIKKSINSLEALLNRSRNLINKQGPFPNTESKGFKEWSSNNHSVHLKTAYSQGSILLEVAADHLSAFVSTLQEPIQTIAPWTCARSVLETTSLSIWLLN